MKAIAIHSWEDMENVSRLASEAPILGLKTINNGINEKTKILIRKNLGIEVNESLLWMQDRYFMDIVNAMLINGVIDLPLSKQLVRYKKLLNYRHSEYLGSDIKKICTDGMVILESL